MKIACAKKSAKTEVRDVLDVVIGGEEKDVLQRLEQKVARDRPGGTRAEMARVGFSLGRSDRRFETKAPRHLQSDGMDAIEFLI